MRDLSEKNPRLKALKSAITVHTNPYIAYHDAHTVIILTEWDMFSNKRPITSLMKPLMQWGLGL